MSATKPFTSFQSAADFLFEQVPKNSSDVGVGPRGFDKSQRWLAALGDVQNACKPLHIAATSGKGTVAAMLEAILRAHGFTTVTLTSPHVYSVTERVRINGEPISEKDFVAYLNKLLPAYDEFTAAGDPPSYFEVNIAIGFLAAAELNVDYTVVETGLGGLLDTTNTIERQDKIAIVGQIGFDHTAILGNSLSEIAAQKAGIIHYRQQVVALEQEPEVNAVIANAASAQRANVSWATGSEARHYIGELSALNTSLSGVHQYDNAALALAAARIAAARDGWKLSANKVKTAWQQLSIPGRFEIVHSGELTVVLDGAHNPQKLRATMDAMAQQFPGTHYGAVFASGQSKATDELLAMLQAGGRRPLILTEYHSRELDMYRPAVDFANYASLPSGAQHLSDPKSVVRAMRQSATDVWLVTGSFYLLSDIRQALEAEAT